MTHTEEHEFVQNVNVIVRIAHTVWGFKMVRHGASVLLGAFLASGGAKWIVNEAKAPVLTRNELDSTRDDVAHLNTKITTLEVFVTQFVGEYRRERSDYARMLCYLTPRAQRENAPLNCPLILNGGDPYPPTALPALPHPP